MPGGPLRSSIQESPATVLGALSSAGPGIAVGIAVVVILFVWRSNRLGLASDRALQACAVAALCALAGTRLYHLLTSGAILELSASQWLSNRGTGSWGAYLGALLGFLLYFRLAKRNPWPALDVVGSVAGLGTFFGRIGCLLAGCDFGQVTSVPWAVHYPPGTLAYLAHAKAGQLAPDAVRSLGVHPLQLYLAVNGLIVFLVASAIWRRWRRVPGVTLASFWVLYGVTRFLWEFLRDPAAGGAVSGLSLSQIMALVAVGIGAAIGLTVLMREHARPPALQPSR